MGQSKGLDNVPNRDVGLHRAVPVFHQRRYCGACLHAHKPADRIIWTMFGVGLRGLLADPVRVKIFNISMALLLVASLWPIIAEYVRFST